VAYSVGVCDTRNSVVTKGGGCGSRGGGHHGVHAHKRYARGVIRTHLFICIHYNYIICNSGVGVNPISRRAPRHLVKPDQLVGQALVPICLLCVYIQCLYIYIVLYWLYSMSIRDTHARAMYIVYV